MMHRRKNQNHKVQMSMRKRVRRKKIKIMLCLLLLQTFKLFPPKAQCLLVLFHFYLFPLSPLGGGDGLEGFRNLFIYSCKGVASSKSHLYHSIVHVGIITLRFKSLSFSLIKESQKYFEEVVW